jgi:hypothetical protein
MINKKLFNEIQSQIDAEVSIICKTNGVIPIIDGVVDFEHYFGCKNRIMWVLKEPNSEGEVEPWSMRDTLRKLKDESGIKKGWEKTFSSIVYVTYGIINDQNWSSIPYVYDNPDIVDILKSIAYINIKKDPGGSKSNYSELMESAQLYKEIIFKQLDLIRPEIIICGGTFDFLDSISVGSTFKNFNQGPLKAYSNGNQLIIDAYHPGARNISREKYFNLVFETASYWLKLGKN